MTSSRFLLFSIFAYLLAPQILFAQSLTDVSATTYEREAIFGVLQKGWMTGQTVSRFGYGVAITPDDWFRMLMFLRTPEACPEFGDSPNAAWTPENIRACLAGNGVPVLTERPDQIRRDEAMQQLFALRQKSFAFQQLQTRPAEYIDPLDIRDIPAKRVGSMIAADRLKLVFRTKNALLPASPLFREDAALSVWRFTTWEQQGGVEKETNERIALTSQTTLNHWRDLDTDMYVVRVKTDADTYLHPILPSRSFNPAPSTSTASVRDEFVYEPVSRLAEQSGAIAAVNGSYFNVSWPWGALEDVAILNGKTVLSRTDRSTFIVCADGKMFIGTFTEKNLKSAKCKPEQALGAGPLFMSQGKVLDQSTKEGFDEYTQWERRVGKNARTAVAISADRKTAYLIVVAGKSYPAFGRGGSSLGSFLQGKYPDISEAMMYDGGSSTSLVAQGNLLVGMGVSGNMNERAVVSALGVFSRKQEKLAATRFKKEQKIHWDPGSVTIKVPKPAQSFAWQSVKSAKTTGVQLALSGSRGKTVQVLDAHDGVTSFAMTFDLFAQDETAKLIMTRREGTHELGWKIPTEIHVIDRKDLSDTDIVKLLAYLPAAQKPDLKTFDAVAFRPSGVVFGDATGRYWFYYAKGKQLSPATFIEKTKK